MQTYRCSAHDRWKCRRTSEKYGNTNETCNHVWNSGELSKIYFRSGKAWNVFAVSELMIWQSGNTAHCCPFVWWIRCWPVSPVHCPNKRDSNLELWWCLFLSAWLYFLTKHLNGPWNSWMFILLCASLWWSSQLSVHGIFSANVGTRKETVVTRTAPLWSHR